MNCFICSYLNLISSFCTNEGVSNLDRTCGFVLGFLASELRETATRHGGLLVMFVPVPSERYSVASHPRGNGEEMLFDTSTFRSLSPDYFS